MQEARYDGAMKDLNKAQMQLDEKQAELEAVQAQYSQAMVEKQVCKTKIIKKLYNKIISFLKNNTYRFAFETQTNV